MVGEQEILKKLVVDEKDLTRDLEKLVEQVVNIFRIEKTSGRIIFEDFESLSDKQRIFVLLVGKYYAKRLNITKDASMNIAEIAKELHRPKTTLSKPLGQIYKDGFVEKLPQGKYIIVHHRIKDIINKKLLTPK